MSSEAVSKSKRSALGFDDSEDEAEVALAPQKRAKTRVFKPIFKPTTRISDDAAESIELVQSRDSETKEIDDYLQMEIRDQNKDEKGKNSQMPTEPEDRPNTMTRLKTSLFGQIVPDEHLISDQAPKSKGLLMMEKMGFKVGDTLGKDNQNKDALLEPIVVIPKGGKGGLGTRDETPDRDFQEEKIVMVMTKEEEEDFKKWKAEETKASKLEWTLRKMQKYCFEFEGDANDNIEKVNLKDLSVMWRGYVKSVQDAIKKKKESVLLNAEGALNVKTTSKGNADFLEQEESEENEEDVDEELEMFEQQSLDQKVVQLNAHLRSNYNFCFFCGVRYSDQADLYSNCPGRTEEDHY